MGDITNAPLDSLPESVAPMCTLHVASRAGVPVIGGMVSEAADTLGLSSNERASLRSLVQEVLVSVLHDSFPDQDALDIDVHVERRPGGMAVVIEDRGAPSRLALGDYPPRIADLIRLGFANDLSVVNQGRKGNRTEIIKEFTYRSVTDDAAFGAAALADETNAPELDADGKPVLEYRAMTPDDVFEIARLFYRTYRYSAYQAAVVYEPERLAEFVRSGHHVATVAVAPSGRIVGHVASEVERVGDRTGRIGLLAVDPAYRGLSVSAQLGFAHMVRLLGLGITGQFSEAVTVHDRSQRAALRAGGHEVGMLLAAQPSTLDFQGFDDGADHRRAVMLFYLSAGEPTERTVHVPTTFVEIAERLYRETQLPRTIVSGEVRRPEPENAESRFQVKLRQEGSAAFLTVDTYGRDFDQALQAQLTELRRNRYDAVFVQMPLSNELTSHFGNGLNELGLSFAGIYPEFSDGDYLVLQCLNDVPVDPDHIVVASPLGEYVRDFVVADHLHAVESRARLLRSKTQMARLYNAIQ